MNGQSKKLRLALPVGSLNNPERGNTRELLRLAGFDIAGYEPGEEMLNPVAKNDPELELAVDRPQDMPVQMLRGVYDAGILGADWAAETGGMLVEVCDLRYGWVRIIAAVKNNSQTQTIDELVAEFAAEGRQLVCSTEYPMIAKDSLTATPSYRAAYGGVEPAMLPESGLLGNWNQAVVVAISAGRTEAKAANGFASLIVEASQTGKSLDRAGLRRIADIMDSTARLYTTQQTVLNPWKKRKLEDLGRLLMSAVRARENEYVPVAMNVPEARVPYVISYLIEAGLVAKAPTVSRYGGNAAVEVLIPGSKYIEAVSTLLRVGANDIINRNTGAVAKDDRFPTLG